MEAAVRWSSQTIGDKSHFLLVDVAGNSISLHEAETANRNQISHRVVAQYDKTPNFTAFDWSKADEGLVAIGQSSGDASLIRIQPGLKNIHPFITFPIKTQRKCNSISFNSQNLLAVALDRVRNDHCLTIYDVRPDGGKEPVHRLCTGEAVSSVRFFPSAPQEVVAAVARSTLRFFDLRESYAVPGAGSVAYTKQVNNIAIDPMDDKYFVSAGSTGDPSVSLWDRRWIARQSSLSGADASATIPVLDLRPAVDNSLTTTVWSVRYSGLKRGRLCVLSSNGEVKLYDTAQHSVRSRSRSQVPANFYGGNAWMLPNYVSRTHHLQYPYHHPTHGQDESTKVIAFDWLSSGHASRQAIVALRPSRDVELLHAPDPTLVRITPRNDLAMLQEHHSVLEPTTTHKDIAEDMLDIRARSTGLRNAEQRPQTFQRQSSGTRPLDRRSVRNLQTSTTATAKAEQWLKDDSLQGRGQVPVSLPEFGDSLTFLDVHRRRCRQGYRFDCKLNKEIARDDLDLVKLWAIIDRLENLARDDGMLTESLDLSFLGVNSIWNEDLGRSINRVIEQRPRMSPRLDPAIKELVERHQLTPLDGMPSRTSDKRRLCLEICGWCFSNEGIEYKCHDLLRQGQHYRAVAVAIFQGHVDFALSLLRELTRAKAIPSSGLGALLASGPLNDEQRDMCRWMEEDATEPYLKALLRYLAANDWLEITNSPGLNLSDRLSVALRYLSDAQVASIVTSTTAASISAGDPSGVLLTGLTDTSMSLFQSYITRTNDIQTAVLATAFANPLYVDDVRWSMWRDTLFWHMQSWRCFLERTRFAVEHGRRAVSRATGARLVAPPPRQIVLRCAHCHGPLARQPSSDDAAASAGSASNDGGGGGRDSGRGGVKSGVASRMSFDVVSAAGKNTPAANAQRVAEAAGTVCLRCGRHMPRCAICMLWLGGTEVVKAVGGGAAAAAAVVPDATREQVVATAAAVEKEMDLLSRFVTFCASCGHGFHAHHATQWFAKHAMCPVPDCRCLCGIRG